MKIYLRNYIAFKNLTLIKRLTERVWSMRGDSTSSRSLSIIGL